MNGKRKEAPPTSVQFEMAGRSNFLRIDLDAILHNVRIMRSKCSSHTEVIAVIKANAYGHGSVAVARHLHTHGVHHFAVATAYEGQELRQAGVMGFIQVLGNCVKEEEAVMRQHQLTPTVSTEAFLRQWAAWPGHSSQLPCPSVVIKVDSGMSRNGCQPQHLPALMQLCSELGVPVHSLMTQFAQAWNDERFTRQQLATFLTAVTPYRNSGVKLQAANTPAVLRGFATDLDFVRLGNSLYGLPIDPSEATVKVIQDVGLRPALCWIAHPNMVKLLPPGRRVGYGQTYVLDKEETIATFSIGYADGYSRQLSNKGVVTTLDGEERPVVGRVSMDAITVTVRPSTTVDTPFYIYSDDLTLANSVAGVARALGTIASNVATTLTKRPPRLYVAGNYIFTADGKMTTTTTLSQCGHNRQKSSND